MPNKFLVHGNVPAVVTPFDAAGEVRYGDFAQLVRWHLSCGVDGICVAGDNGESWTLSLEERRRLAETAVQIAAKKVPVVMGASGISAKQSIAYAEAAAAAGVDALMIGPQAYVMKATTKELVQRMQTIHRAVPLPIVLYNSPRRTNISLTIDTMRAITEAVNIIGLKEASREFFYVSHILHHFADKLAVLIGPAPFIIPGLQLGAAGFISSGPELFGGIGPELMAVAGKPLTPELRKLHFRLTRIYETLMSLGTWPSALKAGHALIGQPGGLPRDPVLPLSDADTATLSAVMTEVGISHAVRRASAAD